MMVAIFATLLAAQVLAALGLRRAALGSTALCLGLSIWLFLFEIHSPDDGFGMPWIQL